jgi:N-carbamoyl-L-amino-acid hydrolase
MMRVNQQRLWDSLMEMATIGATAHGGSCRLALSDDDALGRRAARGLGTALAVA